jgi:TPR repeat protein
MHTELLHNRENQGKILIKFKNLKKRIKRPVVLFAIVTSLIVLCFVSHAVMAAPQTQPTSQDVDKAVNDVMAQAKSEWQTASPMNEPYNAYQHQDYATALRLLRPLADQGDAQAQFYLGMMYGDGQGIQKNYTEAAKWYRKSANHGYDLAANELGNLYEKGNGVPQDYVEAYMWYSIGASGSSVFALMPANNRDRIASKMTSQQIVEALKLVSAWKTSYSQKPSILSNQAPPAQIIRSGGKIDLLRKAGFNQQEINDWSVKTASKLLAAGHSQREVNDYLGINASNIASPRAMMQDNLQKADQEASQPQSDSQQQQPIQVQQEDERQRQHEFEEQSEEGDSEILGMERQRQQQDQEMDAQERQHEQQNDIEQQQAQQQMEQQEEVQQQQQIQAQQEDQRQRQIFADQQAQQQNQQLETLKQQDAQENDSSSFGSNGIGTGAQGWDGRTYIPVDPVLAPGLTPDGYAR